MISGDNNDDNQEFELNDMWSSKDYENNDKSLDDIIQKIEAVRSQVHDLKTRIDKVVSENPRKFCSVTHLSMLGLSDGFNHSDLNSASLAGNALSRRERLSPIIETADGSELEDPWEDVSFQYKSNFKFFIFYFSMTNLGEGEPWHNSKVVAF